MDPLPWNKMGPKPPLSMHRQDMVRLKTSGTSNCTFQPGFHLDFV